MVLLGFCLVAAGMYPTFITFSARAANWPIVALGASVMALGLLLVVAPLSRRLIGIGLLVIAVGLFVLGYPLFGVLGGVNLSWLWIAAVAPAAAAAMIVARGRSWWTLLAAGGLGIALPCGIGLLVGSRPGSAGEARQHPVAAGCRALAVVDDRRLLAGAGGADRRGDAADPPRRGRHRSRRPPSGSQADREGTMDA